MSDTSPKPARRAVPWIVTLCCIALVLLILWQILPTATFSSDLGQIGQGQPTLVMLREIHVMGGEQTLDMMLELHPQFEDHMMFLLSHTGHPDGVAFGEQYRLRDGDLALFDAQGELLGTMQRPQSTNELRAFIMTGLD